ncbi:unnamed protein product [Zymoseptoria tritici ST99CH_1A5]|uniref:Uncharacterized protein n=3 Tax=Zymoseptoria tritici TaxID=1047171 RepID=A0A1X7RMG2_ZYMT9|nr:unnamed protein product [Zymoseptoria tritici ST99CH_3D7]SMR48390.1 unnamed protein product [Zymoseptoria tritici ST99CH_1E4]SMR49603.1 unnamed protein product [Zymoseptoria tritici ST99CH_3D1]SMY22300.1 unnamed protein product [Zymoseptoria tritici ST99CH_1A5]
MAPITLRPPTFSSASQPATFQPPTIPWLAETWHVTHSTLPLWKDKKNVRIQYTPLEPSLPSVAKDQTDRIDDLVTYQKANSDKVNEIRGVDKAANPDSRGEWDWRGKGWLMIASSHWEILGWGEEEGTSNKWMATVFAKTMFTPAGMDIYSQARTGVKPETLAAIKEALAKVDDASVKKMAGEVFEIKSDESRKD